MQYLDVSNLQRGQKIRFDDRTYAVHSVSDYQNRLYVEMKTGTLITFPYGATVVESA